MTQNRRSKRAIRSRMEATGEKYTEARRALLQPPVGSGEPPHQRDVAVFRPEDLLGWFTDQAYNAILLAEDEARMLAHASVEPEHLLLAASRGGNVESLLPGLASAIHDAIIRIVGFGPNLKLRPTRSPAIEEVLRHAIDTAAARGILGPSTEHLLLAVGEKEIPNRILAGLGVSDVQALVDARYPATRPPVEEALVRRRAAQLAAHGRTPPRPGPIPPIFERFTSRAREVIDAGIEQARRLHDPYVEPVHLLLGVLSAEAGIAATVCPHEQREFQPAELIHPRRPNLPMNSSRAPQNDQRLYRDAWTFTPEARRIVAEHVLMVAERLDYPALTTGHLLIALLENPCQRAIELTKRLPEAHEVATAVIAALSLGEEA